MRPRDSVVNVESQNDLIIDVVADVIAKDYTRNPHNTVSKDEAIDMRSRLAKMDKVSAMWFEQKAVEETCQRD